MSSPQVHDGHEQGWAGGMDRDKNGHDESEAHDKKQKPTIVGHAAEEEAVLKLLGVVEEKITVDEEREAKPTEMEEGQNEAPYLEGAYDFRPVEAKRALGEQLKAGANAAQYGGEEDGARDG